MALCLNDLLVEFGIRVDRVPVAALAGEKTALLRMLPTIRNKLILKDNCFIGTEGKKDDTKSALFNPAKVRTKTAERILPQVRTKTAEWSLPVVRTKTANRLLEKATTIRR